MKIERINHSGVMQVSKMKAQVGGIVILVFSSIAAIAATGGCYTWTFNSTDYPYVNSPVLAANTFMAGIDTWQKVERIYSMGNYCASPSGTQPISGDGVPTTGHRICSNFRKVSLTVEAWPRYDLRVRFDCVTTAAYQAYNGTPAGTDCSDTKIVYSAYFPNQQGCFYCAPAPVAIRAIENGECKVGQTPSQSCADPINPATGSMYHSGDSLPKRGNGSLGAGRYYNSTLDVAEAQTGWRYDFSRFITINKTFATYQPLTGAGAGASSLYQSESDACINGFGQIKSIVPNWFTATVSFNNGVCSLFKSGVLIGVLPIYTTYNYPIDQGIYTAASPTSFDHTSDDGRITRFSVVGGVITAPPGTGWKLAYTTSGITLIDGSDNTEQYDTSGRLLSVTSRAGVMETMEYDGSGRLSVVTDSFGNRLIYSYDTQGRLSSVARQ